MRLFNNVLSCVIAFLLFFAFFGLGQLRLEPQETKPKAKQEGPAYRSVFLGIDLKVEITSAVFVREGSDASKTYLYSYLIENSGEKKIKLEFLGSFSGCPGSPPAVCEFEFEAKKRTIATFESKAGPKIVPVVQIVRVSNGEGEWTTEGFNLSFIYAPDVPSKEKKNDSSKNNKNTA